MTRTRGAAAATRATCRTARPRSTALARYEAEKVRGAAEAPSVHPALSLDIDNGQCFGCHSRSGPHLDELRGLARGARAARRRVRSVQARSVRVPHAAGRASVRACAARCPPAARPRLHRLPHVCRGDGRRRPAPAQERAAQGGVRGLPPTAGIRRCRRSLPASSIPESRRILAVRAWPGPAPSHFARTPRGRRARQRRRR